MGIVNPPPILAVDVDGVISLFGFDTPPPASTVAWHLIDGTPHCISLVAGERLGRLGRSFELVWATGWQDRANDRLPQVIGIGPLPVVEFDLPGPVAGAEHDGDGVSGENPERATEQKTVGASLGSLAGHWKLDALGRFAGSRAIAWIDDSLDQSCFDWAEQREAAGLPTLLAPTEPEIGIEEGHVAALESWARGLAPASGPATRRRLFPLSGSAHCRFRGQRIAPFGAATPGFSIHRCERLFTIAQCTSTGPCSSCWSC
jgi:hypothetical protein